MIPNPNFFQDWKLWANKVLQLLTDSEKFFSLERVFNPDVTFTGATVTSSTVEYDPKTGRLTVDATFTAPVGTITLDMAGIDLTSRSKMGSTVGAALRFNGATQISATCRYNFGLKLLRIDVLAGETRVLMNVVV